MIINLMIWSQQCKECFIVHFAFQSGAVCFSLNYMKGFKRWLYRRLRGALLRCGTHFHIGLKTAVAEKCWFSAKIVRRPWAPRTLLEFAIKAGNVLDPWKTFCCPWVFSVFLENSWTVVKLFIVELLITFNIREWRLNNGIMKQVINDYRLSFSNVCLKKCATTLYLKSIHSRHEVKTQ